MTWRDFLLMQKGDWERRKEQMKVTRMQTYILWASQPRKKRRLPGIEKFWPIDRLEKRALKQDRENIKSRAIALLEAKGYKPGKFELPKKLNKNGRAKTRG